MIFDLYLHELWTDSKTQEGNMIAFFYICEAAKPSMSSLIQIHLFMLNQRREHLLS